jgi:transmembrane protein
LFVLGGVAMESHATVARIDRAPRVVVDLLDNAVTLAVARIMVTAPFLAGGLTKLLDWQAGVAEMTHVGLHPAWAYNAAALGTQLVGSVLVILNRRLWLGAGALGIFTVWATLLAHRFWDFAGSERMAQTNAFFEHWTICAAFILVTVVGFRGSRCRP